MPKKDVLSTINQLVLPIVQELGLELWDLEFVKEAGSWFLRVYIDKADGVCIEDCEAVSRKLDKILDYTDPIEQSYVLEVCSAGLERTLKRDSDFTAFIGHKIVIKLYKPYQGSKELTGTLKDFENDIITLEIDEKDHAFSKKDTAMVRLSI